MPATIHIVNRYVNSDNVARAAVVFDGAAIDAKSPRTQANGQVVVATETLSDGNHVMNIVPDQTSADPVGPAVAEGLGKAVTRMYRSLDVNVTVSKGKITTVSSTARPGAERRRFSGRQSGSRPVAACLLSLAISKGEFPSGDRHHAHCRASDSQGRQHRSARSGSLPSPTSGMTAQAPTM